MCSDGADHLCILQLAARAFRAHVGPQVQFPPKTRCDWWGAGKRRFDPRRSLNRAYTPPHALMALIIGASCSSQSGLSEHMWVHIPISRQNSGMPGGVLKHGDLALKRDCVEHILFMALIIGAYCSLQSGLSEHVWVHMPISRHKPQMYSYTYIHAYVWF